MNTFKYVIFITLFISIQNFDQVFSAQSSLVKSNATASPAVVSFTGPNYPVRIGEKVEFRCAVKGTQGKGLIIRRNVNIFSEGCSSFTNNTIKCEGNTVIFTIQNVSFHHEGKWTCSLMTSFSSFILRVYSLGKTEMKLSALPKPIVSTMLGPEAYPVNRENPVILMGKGTKVFPFDLRNDVKVKVYCTSLCAYPGLKHAVKLKNDLNSIEMKPVIYKAVEQRCPSKGSTTIYKATFFCAKDSLRGLYNLTCSTYYAETNKSNISEKSVFVLCPTDPVNPWPLTLYEKVMTTVGCLIGVVLLLLLILLLCRWRTTKYKDFDESCQPVLTTNSGQQQQHQQQTDNGGVLRGYRV